MYEYLIHSAVLQKLTQHCKATTFQFKEKVPLGHTDCLGKGGVTSLIFLLKKTRTLPTLPPPLSRLHYLHDTGGSLFTEGYLDNECNSQELKEGGAWVSQGGQHDGVRI